MKLRHTLLLLVLLLLVAVCDSSTYAQNVLVTGTLKSETGEPIGNGKIYFDLGNYGLKKADSKVLEAASNTKGKFTLNIELDDLADYMNEGHIWIFADGYQVHLDRLKTFSDAPQSFDIVLKKESGIEFTVLSPDGDPIVGAEVTPWHAKMLSGNYSFLPRPLLRAVAEKTDKDGKATLKHFPADRVASVSIKTKNHGDQKHEISQSQIESRKATIELEETGDVKIRFTGGAGKYPLAKLGIWQSSSERGSSSPLIDTNFDKPIELKNIVAGRYQGFASCPDGFELIPDLPSTIDVIPNETVTVDVPLIKPVLISGRIETSTGKTISGARISIQYGKSFSSDSTASDAKGKFEAKVLPGEVIIQVISYHLADYISDEHPRLTFQIEKLESVELDPIVVKATKNEK